MTVPSDRRQKARAAKRLEKEASGYEFVQIVRLLTRLQDTKASIGGWADPATEALRISVIPSLAFPPSEVASITLPDDDSPNEPVHVDVRFLGLTGPQGVLPHVYTTHAAVRARGRDTAFRDFLDLFHHRALSLFYRAWERHHPAVAAEHGDEDRLRQHLDDFAGIGTPAVRAQAGALADALPYYSGLLGLRTRPAAGLSQIVADYFGVPATVEQFVGEWRPVTDGGQVSLGDEGLDGMLGTSVIGNAIYDPHARVRLRLGPLTRQQFDDFLPTGRAHTDLQQLARLYTDDQVGVDAQLVLRRKDVPAIALGAPETPQLGFGTWLRSKPVARDADDVHLTLC